MEVPRKCRVWGQWKRMRGGAERRVGSDAAKCVECHGQLIGGVTVLNASA